MKDYIIPISILISSLIIGFAILGSSQVQTFDHIDNNVVFDKKTVLPIILIKNIFR